MSGRCSHVGLKNEANQHAMIGPMDGATWQRPGIDSSSFKWLPVDSQQKKGKSFLNHTASENWLLPSLWAWKSSWASDEIIAPANCNFSLVRPWAESPFTYRNLEIINMHFKPLSLCYTAIENEYNLPSSFSSRCFSHSDLFLVSQLKHYFHDCGFVEIFTMSGVFFSSFLPVKYNSSFKTQIDSASSGSLDWVCPPTPNPHLPELVESKNLYYSCSCHLELGQNHSVNN